MKTLALSACLAVAASTATAGLKDPAVVASDWNQTIAAARAPVLSDGPLGLNAAPPASAPTFDPPAKAPRARFKGDVLQVPPGWQLDPGFEHVRPGETPPKGAKPWSYRGQKFWIIPIASDGKK